jgi:mRNA interferase MazF
MAFIGSVYRWDLFWVDLEPHVGSEQAGERRPAVVVSNDGANRLATITIVPLTKLEGKNRSLHPFEVRLTGDLMGNGFTSLALPNQVRTIDKRRLLERAGTLANEDDRFAIEGALLDHLGIELEE